MKSVLEGIFKIASCQMSHALKYSFLNKHLTTNSVIGDLTPFADFITGKTKIALTDPLLHAFMSEVFLSLKAYVTAGAQMLETDLLSILSDFEYLTRIPIILKDVETDRMFLSYVSLNFNHKYNVTVHVWKEISTTDTFPVKVTLAERLDSAIYADAEVEILFLDPSAYTNDTETGGITLHSLMEWKFSEDAKEYVVDFQLVEKDFTDKKIYRPAGATLH